MHHLSKSITLCLMLLIVLFYSAAYGCDRKDMEIQVRDNSAFAVDLYGKLCASEGNIFFSPYSISTALAMTCAGARGNTEKEMAETLKFSLGRDCLHPAFAYIESELSGIQKSGNLELAIANSLWPQKDYKFLDEYISLIKEYYGTSITPVDYKRAHEEARKFINEWVERKTEDKIKDLIQRGVLNALTRLVLVNAIYFNGNWESQFRPDRTEETPFHISPDKTVQAPLMQQTHRFRYGEMKDLQVLELPYVGEDLSMFILLPQKGVGLHKIEKDLNIENLAQWKQGLQKTEVVVFLPRFKMSSMFRMDDTLVSMGMRDAFDASRANFSGMDGSHGLYIGAVLHKAFVDVDEEGTEAAAATAVVMARKSASARLPVFRADRPFVFLIQDNKTESILFMGRLTDPAKTE